jgi:hypothetical protein
VRLVPEGNRLRLRDAVTDEPLPWAEEDAEGRQTAEREAEQQARRADEEGRLRAAAERQVEAERLRIRALEEELARLRGGDPGR